MGEGSISPLLRERDRVRGWIVTNFFWLPLILLLAACSTPSPEPTLPSQTDRPTLPATPTLATGLAAASEFPPTPIPLITLPGEAPIPTVAPTASPLPSPTPTATPTAQSTPTATPDLGQRQEMIAAALRNQNYPQAIIHLEVVLSEASLTNEEQRAYRYQLGLAYLAEGNLAQAAAAFNLYLAQNAAAPTSEQTSIQTSIATYHLGETLRLQGDCQGAIGAYQSYVTANPELAAYIQPRIGDCYLLLGNRANAITAYENALRGNAHRLVIVPIRQTLANFYREDGRYDEAIAQYDAIIAIAQTEFTKGQMNFLAGQTYLQANNLQAAYQRFLSGVRLYPTSYDSYQGLVILVEANVPVDEFQRGLVNFHAKSYLPAIAAFNRLIEANPDNYREDLHLYLAWCYEGLGDLPNALDQIEQYRAISITTAAPGLIEKGRLLVRAGQSAAALTAYTEFIETMPQEPQAADAAWWVAVLSDRLRQTQNAAAAYQKLAADFPNNENAPYALFRAGWLYEQMGARDAATAAWQQLLARYPNTQWGAAAMIWLLRVLPEDAQGPVRDAAAQASVLSYYGLRARDLAADIEPFQRDHGIVWAMSGQEAAENWLRQVLDLNADSNISQLSQTLAQDERLVRGQKLWQIGLYEAAKRELEAVREANANNTLASYQLALYFRDLGLYRSSILSANAVLRLTTTTVYSAPKFIGQLSYPLYYQDLVLPQAEQYGYDPLIQFSLLRQESLFESFATSTAIAQGLSQVIPSTGTYIANRLNWPNYQNEHLYRPYVGLAFGAFYLDEQLRLFDGFVPAALSAYNAGPGNALRWYDQAGRDLDQYVETVNFPETRLYIERIYSGYVIYRYLYQE